MENIKRKIKLKLYKYFFSVWNIGIADFDENFELTKIKWLNHSYKDRWFADPFIIDETSENFIYLVEEYPIFLDRGRIAKLTIRKKDFKLIKNETILEKDTHLSFPNYIKLKNDHYILPENIASGSLSIYNYKKNIYEIKKLLDISLADPVILEYDKYYYLLGTTGNNINGNILKIYKSKNILGDYSEFQTIAFSNNIARRAGSIFRLKNMIISPAQICDHRYGEGLSLQQITFDKGKFNLKEIKRIFPVSNKYPEGIHTFNVHNNKVAIDGYKYFNKFLHNIYFKLRGFED